jgi:hypothetical protein
LTTQQAEIGTAQFCDRHENDHHENNTSIFPRGFKTWVVKDGQEKTLSKSIT